VSVDEVNFLQAADHLQRHNDRLLLGVIRWPAVNQPVNRADIRTTQRVSDYIQMTHWPPAKLSPAVRLIVVKADPCAEATPLTPYL